MQYSEMIWKKYTRYGNYNEPAARKYFAKNQNAQNENITVNETGFKVNT